MVLVGPTGVLVLAVSSLKGSFRAQGEAWWVVNDRNLHVRPAQPNLLTLSQQMAQAVQAYLELGAGVAPAVEAVLVFPQPEMKVNAIRPAVRVVLKAGLDRWVTGLQARPVVLGGPEIQAIVERLAGTGRSNGSAKAESSPVEMPIRLPAPAQPAGKPEPHPWRERFHLSRIQTVLLVAFGILELLLLAAFTWFFLMAR